MSLLTIPLFVLATVPATLEDVKLQRVFTVGDVDRYAVKVTINEDSGPQIEASAEVTATIKKALEGGKAEIARSMEKLVFKVDGQPQEMPKADERLDNFDKFGMPDSMEVEGPQVVFVIQAFSGFSPNATVAVGGEFDIKWKAADDSITLKGKGTLAEVVVIDGAKYAKLTSKLTVAPKDDSEGVVTYTSWLAVDGGKLLKAEGNVAIQGTSLTFKVDKVKK